MKPRASGAGPLLRVAVASATMMVLPVLVQTDDVRARVATAINTLGYEDSPYLSPDGANIYFMYTPWTVWPVFFGRPPVLVGPEREGHHINPQRNPWEDTDLYVSSLEDGRWSTPRNLEFNDDQADCCAMTWDGDLFAYQRTQRPSDALTDIYFIRRMPDGQWARVSAGPAVNLPQSSERNPHLTADGRALFFTSDRPGGFGKADLYISCKSADGSWRAPRNLGPLFNSPEDDDQIWVSRDGRTIFFNREPGPRILETRWSEESGWSTPTEVLFGGDRIQGAEVSLDDNQDRMVFAQVRPDLEDIVFVVADRRLDGRWGAARPFESGWSPSDGNRPRLRAPVLPMDEGCDGG